MIAKPDFRVLLKWMIARSGSEIADFIRPTCRSPGSGSVITSVIRLTYSPSRFLNLLNDNTSVSLQNTHAHYCHSHCCVDRARAF